MDNEASPLSASFVPSPPVGGPRFSQPTGKGAMPPLKKGTLSGTTEAA